MKRIILLCCFFCAIWSCGKKDTPQPTEEKPIKLETLLPESLGSQGIKLLGRVLYLNNEKIVEQGFVLSYGMQSGKTESLVYKIDQNTQTGSNFTIIDKLPEQGYEYSIKYYIKTENKTYEGLNLIFSIFPILVDPLPESYVSPGQEINITGDFTKLDNTYRILAKTTSSTHGNPIPFSLSTDKKTLTFSVPDNLTHGAERDFVLYNHRSNYIYLTKVLIMGYMNPMTNYIYYYDEIIKFTGIGLPQYDEKSFQIVLGNKLLPYRAEYEVSELLADLRGTSHRIGYYNGVDTTIFPKKFELHVPPTDIFKFRQTKAHPASTIMVNAGDLARHVPILHEMPTLDGKATYLIPTWNHQDRMTIQDLPNGSYPAVFKNHIYNYTSKQTIAIEKLKVDAISPSAIYVGEKVSLSGNFINGMVYTVITNAGQYGSLIGSNGTIEFYPTDSHIDELKVQQVGYHNERGGSTWIDTDLKVDVKPTTFTGFSPAVGTHDTKITLYGQGIPGAHIYIAGQRVYSYEAGPGYVELYTPWSILPGKHKIALRFKNQWLTLDQLFELK